jgi:class 3 adenylate cyclase/pimeloyl-ACP methyl ester carboxylesterase
VPEVPVVEYVQTDAGAIAFQRWGEGDIDLLFMTNWSTSVDNIWEHPGRVRLLRHLGTAANVVRFDASGFGASDPVPLEQAGLVETWARNAIDVLDACGIERCAIAAEVWAAQVAIYLAAHYPERIERLFLLNPLARLLAAPDYPIGRPERTKARAVENAAQHWGDGSITAAAVPTLARGAPDPGFLGRTERLGASRAAATAMTERIFTTDVRELLARVSAPTLAVYTGDSAMVSRELCEYVADRIPGAVLVDAPSRSFYWSDDTMDTYTAFMRGESSAVVARELLTVVFTDIVSSTPALQSAGDRLWAQQLNALNEFVRIEVERGGGRVVSDTGDGHLMTFPAPNAALVTVERILQGMGAFDFALRAGAHVGEVELRGRGEIGGLTVHVAQRVSSLAGAGELVVSRTVADLLAGSSWRFADRGEHSLKGVDAPWQLFSVVVRE